MSDVSHGDYEDAKSENYDLKGKNGKPSYFDEDANKKEKNELEAAKDLDSSDDFEFDNPEVFYFNFYRMKILLGK